MKMDNLQTLLFQETLKARELYNAADTALGACPDASGLWQIRTVRHQRFCALYSLIEKAQLEDEYQLWKGTQDIELLMG